MSLFINSFNKYLLNTYNVSAINKTESFFPGSLFSKAEGIDNT